MNILVATDFSDNSRSAVRWGAFFANQLGSDMKLIHVVDLAAGDNAWRILVETPEEIEREALVETREKLEEFFDDCVEERPESVDFRAVLGSPSDELLAEAELVDDPILVVGTRGASRLRELFLGNTARRLVRSSKYPVIMVPPKAVVSEPKNLVVGVDFSKPSREAVRRAALMARTYDARLHLVYGYVLPEVATFDGTVAATAVDSEELIQNKEAALRKMVEEIGAEDVLASVASLQLPPARAVTTTAEELGAEFIFVGTHGRRGVSRFFLGNTAERVMREATCAVFVVPVEESNEETD